MIGRFFVYLTNRANEYSSWIAVFALATAVLALPKSLTAFIIMGLVAVIILLPDMPISKKIKRYLR